MIDPTLLAYVSSCIQQGYTPDALRPVLLQSGWDPAQVEEVLGAYTVVVPVLPPQPMPAKPKRAHRLKVATLSTLVVLVAFSVPIAFAEQGYLPAFSQVYRKTPLPLLWHGTTGSPSITALQAIQAIGKAPVMSDQGTYSVTVAATNPKEAASFSKWPQVADLLTPKKEAFADISDTSQTDDQASSEASLLGATADNYLPFSVTLSDLTEYDQNQDYHLKLSLDFGDSFKKLQDLNSFLPTLQQKLTAEGLLISGTKNAYVRSSLIPYQKTADLDKWLQFPIPDDYINELKNDKGDSQTLSSNDLRQYKAILDASVKDSGIVRKDGQPYAQYLITITPATLRTLSQQPLFKDSAAELTELAGENATLTDTMWLNPHTAQIMFNDSTVKASDSTSNLSVTLTTSDAYAYQLDTPLVAPQPDQTIQDGSGYLDTIFGQILSGSASDSSADLSGSL